MTLRLKHEAARAAERLGHELRPWQHDVLHFLVVTECRICGATVRIRNGEIQGDATTTACSRLNGNRHLHPNGDVK